MDYVRRGVIGSGSLGQPPSREVVLSLHRLAARACGWWREVPGHGHGFFLVFEPLTQCACGDYFTPESMGSSVSSCVNCIFGKGEEPMREQVP